MYQQGITLLNQWLELRPGDPTAEQWRADLQNKLNAKDTTSIQQQ